MGELITLACPIRFRGMALSSTALGKVFMSDIALPKLSAAEDAFKSLIWDPEAAAVKVAIFKGALAIPVVGSIIGAVYGVLSDFVFSKVRLFVDLGAIRLVDQVRQRAYDDVSVQLKEIERSSGMDSDEYKKARDEAKASFSQFVHVNG